LRIEIGKRYRFLGQNHAAIEKYKRKGKTWKDYNTVSGDRKQTPVAFPGEVFTGSGVKSDANSCF
jgi:hypothetical protein